jgi:hypothetical protein
MENVEICEYGCYVDELTIDQPAISDDAEKYLLNQLGRAGLAGFMQQELFPLLAEGRTTLPSEFCPISELENAPDSAALAKRLLEMLAEIPRSYQLIMRAPAALSRLNKRIGIDYEVTNRLKIPLIPLTHPRSCAIKMA